LISKLLFGSIVTLAVIALLVSPVLAFGQGFSGNGVIALNSSNYRCPQGKVCTATLTSVNTACLSGTTVTIVIDNTGSNTVLQVSASPPSGDQVSGIAEIAYQNTTQVSSASAGSWQFSKQGSKNIADFGTFLNDLNGNPGVKASAVNFTLSGMVTAFTPNSDGNMFAVHVKLLSDCTGYVSGSSGIIVTPEFPLGAMLAILAPIAAMGLYVAVSKKRAF
jgi:hypothetical protein